MALEKLALLHAVGAYVPRLVLQQAMVNPDQAIIGEEARERAALLFADVSGFTQMSESLAQLGKEGAEELTSVLNAYFTTMIDLVHRYGGVVIKFGGDAITCRFAEGVEGLVRACACALAMQDEMTQFAAVQTRGGVFNLRMKIGISAGPVLSMSVGQPEAGVEYVLAGRALDRMSAAEHHAAAGEVLVDSLSLESEALYDTLGLTIAERRDEFLQITGLAYKVTPLTAAPTLPSVAPELVPKVIEHLVSYVPATLYEQIREGHTELLGEHRWVVSLFVNFMELEYDTDPQAGEKLQTYFTTMQTIIHRYGGRLNRVITGDKGSLLHIIFGAPVAHEDNEERAVGCALEMQRIALKSGQLPFITDQQIGIAAGYVFAGNVGSEERREYTVMGDVVNLSSRLMQAASAGEILMDQPTAQRVAQDFVCDSLPPIRVKGKAEPVAVSRAVSVRRESKRWGAEAPPARRRDLPIVGRQQELDQVQAIIERVLKGQGQLLVINGEAGIGKSRLLQALIEMAREVGMHGYQGDCVSYGTQTPYLPWIDFFNAFFDLNSVPDDNLMEKIYRIERRMAAVDPELARWAPLIGQTLGLSVPDNELTASLNAELRKQRTFELVLALLRDQAQQERLFLMVFEDVHWIDAISLEMLNYVARNIGDYPILLAALQRPTIELTEWPRHPYYHRLNLLDLPAESALELVRHKLRMDEVPPALRERVLRGEELLNPFFVEEVINALVDQGYLLAIPGDEEEEYLITGDLSEAQIPDSIQALVMSRIDRLDESSKLTVKVASAIGRVFQYHILLSIYPVSVARERLLANLEKLDRIDLTPLDKPAPELAYIFKHITTQEVAYESLLYKHRRELHHSIGEYVEATYPDTSEEHYELLAYHYRLSGDQAKAWTYLVKAGDKAKKQYANEAAVDYYTQALGLEMGSEPDNTYQVHESLGDVFSIIGQYEEARDHYRTALSYDQPHITQSAEIRRKIAKTWELQGRYDEALQYLNLTREMLSETERSPELARIYNDMAWVDLQRGIYDDALHLCQEGIEIAEQLSRGEKNHRLQAELQHTLGSIHLRKAEHKLAIANFQSSAEDWQAIDDFYNIGRTYNNLAVVYWQRGDYGLAAQYINRSLEEFSKVGYTYGTAMCYNNLGAISYTLGNYAQAIAHYEKSLSIRQEIGDLLGIAAIYNNLGDVYQKTDEFQRAHHYLLEAVDLLTEIGEKRFLNDAYKLLAEVELKLGDTQSALMYGERSLSLAQEIGNREYEGITYRVLGQIHRAEGALETARTRLENSIEILTELDNKLEIAHSYEALGRTLLDMGERAEGQSALEHAIEIFTALGLEKEVEDARRALN